MSLSMRLIKSALVATGTVGAVVLLSPSAHAAPTASPRCWLTCTASPAPAPSQTAPPVPVSSPAPAPTEAPTPGPVTYTKPPRPQLTGGEVAELLSLINGHRRSRGIAPVSLDAQLSDIARAHTAVMIQRNLLHHNDSLFTRETHQRTGIKLFAENVGYGSGVRDNHDGFLNSLHHRENMEGSAYTLVGLAVGRSSDGRIWVTEDFGTPRAGGTTVAARPAPRAATAPRPTTTERRTTTAPRRVATPSAPKAKAKAKAKAKDAPRVLAAAPATAALAGATDVSAPVIDESDDRVAAPVTLATSTRSSTAPIGAGVAAGLAALGLLVVAPRRRPAAAGC